MSEQLSARSGDLRAVVTVLVESHGPKWLRFVARIVGSPEDAQDVLQEAVHRVLARNRSFGSDEEVRLYLGRAITNRAFELYHARKLERIRRVVLEDTRLPAVDSWSPQRQLEERERDVERQRVLALVREGLTRLPPKQYEALSLTLLEPIASSIRDAGLERGIPYSTLRHRSLQGIRRLQRFVRRALRRTEQLGSPG
jgi:RNA polymerase sigma factor (sigma-70 family)